jgi:putative transcriptional regulator
MDGKSFAGHLLIAVPELLDPNFNESVVLLIQHDGDGASGLILNRATQTTIEEVFTDGTSVPTAKQPIYLGGPVEGPLMAIHGCVSLAEKDIVENVYFSINSENIQGIVQQTLRPFRLFFGYSGWGPGQLENELQVGGWLVLPASADLIFGDEVNLWKFVSNQVGLDIIFSKPVSLPHDPGAN